MLICSTAFENRKMKEKPEMKQKGEDEGVMRSIDRKQKRQRVGRRLCELLLTGFIPKSSEKIFAS